MKLQVVGSSETGPWFPQVGAHGRTMRRAQQVEGLPTGSLLVTATADDDNSVVQSIINRYLGVDEFRIATPERSDLVDNADKMSVFGASISGTIRAKRTQGDKSSQSSGSDLEIRPVRSHKC